MKFIRYILIILVPLYYLLILFRNKLYDWQLLKSIEFDIPVICVGNLNVGGTGKTPMIEYLISLLNQRYRVATLSRGYKRKTSGFILAGQEDTADTIGDEPFQFYKKFEDVLVAVDGNRRRGISSLRNLPVPPDLILLDDAFQHRAVKAGLNILLTAYGRLYVDDMMLPTGDLREPVSGRKRAQVVIVTKCPPDMKDDEKTSLRRRLMISDDQDLFFSFIKYSDKVMGKKGSMPLKDLSGFRVSLITGIADPAPLKNHLTDIGLSFEHLEFGDHHYFSEDELESFREKDLILTTEKDYFRIEQTYGHDNIWYLPIEVELDRSDAFKKRLFEYTGD